MLRHLPVHGHYYAELIYSESYPNSSIYEMIFCVEKNAYKTET